MVKTEMFARRDIHENDKSFKQIGIKNKLSFLSLIDEFIRKNEFCRKQNLRDDATNKRVEMDQKLIEERERRLQKERDNNSMALLQRIQEFDIRKRKHIDAAQKRFQQIEKESKERYNCLKQKVQKVKLQTHKFRERERIHAAELNQRMKEREIAQKFSTAYFPRIRDVVHNSEMEFLQKRMTELDQQKAKSQAETEQNIQMINRKQKQKLENSLKRFRDVERKYEKDAFSLVSKINELEKEKERQRDLLRQRNDEFRQELERREKIASFRREKDKKMQEDNINKLKDRISNLVRRKDKLTTDFQENILNLKAKHEQNKQAAYRRRRRKEDEITQQGEQMWKRIDELSEQKERNTNKVLSAIQKIKKKKELSLNKSSAGFRPISRSQSFSHREIKAREMEQKRKWDMEAKEREQQRIKDAFRKLMESFNEKSKTIPY